MSLATGISAGCSNLSPQAILAHGNNRAAESYLMNVAQARPRTWTPQIILFSIILHAAIIYYVAVAFNVVPIAVPTDREPPTITVQRLPPQPPIVEPDLPKPPDPRVRPRNPLPNPVPPQVQTIPLPPQPAVESTANATQMVVNQPIPEQPIAQGLPRYPSVAEARQIEGKVQLSITIMPDGSVRDVRVVSAKPSGYFEAEAVRAVQTWRYKPSSVTRMNVIVDIDFVLT
jgi:TonB family protein